MWAVSSSSVSAGGMASAAPAAVRLGIMREQFVERADADRREHRPLVFSSVDNVRHGVKDLR